jgi:hypothetical protein
VKIGCPTTIHEEFPTDTRTVAPTAGTVKSAVVTV